MNVRLHSLTLGFVKERVVIDLGHSVNVFYGPISTGKSSLLHLIDYCFGAELISTVAIQKEFISATLGLRVGENDVIIDRSRHRAGLLVTWLDRDGKSNSILAPLAEVPGEPALIDDDVKTFSDLMLYLAGQRTLRVPKAPTDPDSTRIRLSWRDFMAFCYLEQNDLDSTFFSLTDKASFKTSKSREVLRYVLGFNSIRLDQLARELEERRSARSSNESASERLLKVLEQVAEGLTRVQLRAQLSEQEQRVKHNEHALADISEDYRSATRFYDEQRRALRNLSNEIDKESIGFQLQEIRLSDLTSLRAEFIALKFKAERTLVAMEIIGEVKFEHCPACSSEVKAQGDSILGHCYLCKSDLEQKESSAERLTIARDDLDSKIFDVENTIAELSNSVATRARVLAKKRDEKDRLDRDFSAALQDYDSVYVQALRTAERDLATAQGQLKQTTQLLDLFATAERIQGENAGLDKEIARLRRLIEEEQLSMTRAQETVRELADEFKNVLLAVGMPNVEVTDSISLNVRNWIPHVISADQDSEWSYDTAGSGGKRVLFVVSFAIALHIVAARNDLPLPTLLMLDSPSKNVARDENESLIRSLYDTIYFYADNQDTETQFTIVDSLLQQPGSKSLDFNSRRIANEPGCRPLIPYYEGA